MNFLDFSNLVIQQNYQCKRSNKNWSHFTTSSRNQIRGVYQERSEGLVEDRIKTFVTSLLSHAFIFSSVAQLIILPLTLIILCFFFILDRFALIK